MRTCHGPVTMISQVTFSILSGISVPSEDISYLIGIVQGFLNLKIFVVDTPSNGNSNLILINNKKKCYNTTLYSPKITYAKTIHFTGFPLLSVT